MIAAGQAGFSKARDPKVSAFLRWPRQGLSSPGWQPSPLPTRPETGFHASLSPVRRFRIDSGPEAAGRVGGVGRAGDSIRETPLQGPLSLSLPRPCTPPWSSDLRGSSGVGIPLDQICSTSHRPPPSSPQFPTLHLARHRTAAASSSGQQTQCSLANWFQKSLCDTCNQRDSRMMWKAWRPQSRF